MSNRITTWSRGRRRSAWLKPVGLGAHCNFALATPAIDDNTFPLSLSTSRQICQARDCAPTRSFRLSWVGHGVSTAPLAVDEICGGLGTARPTTAKDFERHAIACPTAAYTRSAHFQTILNCGLAHSRTYLASSRSQIQAWLSWTTNAAVSALNLTSLLSETGSAWQLEIASTGHTGAGAPVLPARASLVGADRESPAICPHQNQTARPPVAPYRQTGNSMSLAGTADRSADPAWCAHRSRLTRAAFWTLSTGWLIPEVLLA